jgi:hypothetical protein
MIAVVNFFNEIVSERKTDEVINSCRRNGRISDEMNIYLHEITCTVYTVTFTVCKNHPNSKITKFMSFAQGGLFSGLNTYQFSPFSYAISKCRTALDSPTGIIKISRCQQWFAPPHLSRFTPCRHGTLHQAFLPTDRGVRYA